MKSVNEFSREYSEIPGLQHAAVVRYKLFAGQEALLFEVGECRCSIEGISQAYAERLLQFLYENGIAPENVFGVLQDCCGPMVRQV